MTGSCDCCGKVAVLHSGYAAGIETYACASCFGHPADEWDDEAADPLVFIAINLFAAVLLTVCGIWITG